MTHTDKQPQTCYVQVDVKSNVRPDFMMTRLPKGDKSFLNGYPLYVTELPNRLIHTHEELEALKAECCIGLLEWMNKVVQESPMMLETDNDDIVSMYLQSIS